MCLYVFKPRHWQHSIFLNLSFGWECKWILIKTEYILLSLRDICIDFFVWSLLLLLRYHLFIRLQKGCFLLIEIIPGRNNGSLRILCLKCGFIRMSHGFDDRNFKNKIYGFSDICGVPSVKRKVAGSRTLHTFFMTT